MKRYCLNHYCFNGFSLIELIIATFLFSVGAVTILGVLSTGIFSSSQRENLDTALYIAEAKLEELKNSPFASLTDSRPSPDTNFSEFNVRVDIGEGQNPMPVEVEVSWQTKGGTAKISLTTLIADY